MNVPTLLLQIIGWLVLAVGSLGVVFGVLWLGLELFEAILRRLNMWQAFVEFVFEWYAKRKKGRRQQDI